jgi:arginine exporter protein ArgO
MNITYWAGLGGTVAVLAPGHAGWQPFAVFLAGFMASSLIWCFVCAGLVAATRRMLGPLLWRTLNFGCAAGLAAFAVLVVARLFGFEV